jgi:hypothetical protein
MENFQQEVLIKSKIQALQIAVLLDDRAEMVRIARELRAAGVSVDAGDVMGRATAVDLARVHTRLLQLWIESLRDAEACPPEQRGEARLLVNRLRVAVDALKAKLQPSGELTVWAEDRVVMRAQALLAAREALGRSWQAARYGLLELIAASRMTGVIWRLRLNAAVWWLLGR